MEDDRLVRVLKALADPKRFRMVREVAAAGELTCGQLGERFQLSQPTVSHHLRILTEAEVLHSRTEARHHHLTVNHELLDKLGAVLHGRFGAVVGPVGDTPADPARDTANA